MPRCLASAKHSWQRSLTILKTAAHTRHRARANSGTTTFIGLSEQAVAREPDQCLEAFLAFLPLCLTLRAPFLALPLTTLALCLAFLPTPMTDSLSLGHRRCRQCAVPAAFPGGTVSHGDPVAAMFHPGRGSNSQIL